MQRLLLSLAFLIVALGSTAGAQNPLAGCVLGDAQVDSLRSIAVRLYPEAVAPARHTAFVTVALVLDSDCRVIHRAMGTRPRQGSLSADTVIARLIPEASGFRYSTGGFGILGELSESESASLARARSLDPSARKTDQGFPLLVWGARDPKVRK